MLSFRRLVLLTIPLAVTGHTPAQAQIAIPSFTAAQAEQGQALFARRCAVCHGAGLEGGVAPPLSGAAFSQAAAAQKLSVKSLYDTIAKTMPMTAPGSLKPEEYEALTAFLLRANGFSAGATPFGSDDPAQAQILLAKGEASGGQIASGGVYSVAQAARGKALYSDNCLNCHGGDLHGVEDSPSLAGGAFLAKWGGQPVGAVHRFIDKNMPPGNGGALGAVSEADIVAYIMSVNGFPAGPDPLPSNSRGLDAIILDKAAAN